MTKTKIIIVDDHQMLSEALAEIIEKDSPSEVLFTARNGRDLVNRLDSGGEIPDLVLLDINMPEMDGHETAQWLSANYPQIKIVVLTMNATDEDVIKMVKAGCCGYILKEASRAELREGIQMVMEKGYFHSDLIAHKLVNILRNENRDSFSIADTLNEREKEFLPYACSELTYKEIADRMCVSERTVDGYRESLFRKFEVKSRVGLAIFAIRNELVKI